MPIVSLNLSTHSLLFISLWYFLQLNPPQNFDQRSGGGFTPRNDYPNQPQNYGGRPMDSMTRTNPMGRPDAMSRSDPMSSRPDTMHNRQESMSGRLDPMSARSDPMSSRPDTMHSRPDTMTGRLDPMHSRSSTIPGRPDPLHGRPDTMHGRQEPIQGRQDAMHGRPDGMHSRSEPMHGRPDSMHGRSESLLGRPDGRPDPWSTTGNQWGSNQVQSQPHVQNNFNYQQKTQMNTYGQQVRISKRCFFS